MDVVVGIVGGVVGVVARGHGDAVDCHGSRMMGKRGEVGDIGVASEVGIAIVLDIGLTSTH